MKQTIIYIWFATLCVMHCGCSDFLEEYSKDQVYAASCEDLNEVLIGSGYMKSGEPWRNSVNMGATSYYPELVVLDDDVEELITESSDLNYNSPVIKLRNFYTWQQNPFKESNAKQNDITDHTFEQMYKHIGYVNVIINYVDEFPNDPIEDQKQVRGEGQFLRGAYYLMLNNLYGLAYDKNSATKDLGVPLNTTEYVEDKYYSRASVQEVYDVIVNDLKNACENLRGIKQKNFYRTNQLAARILLSRVYLYMGDYKNAIIQSDSALLLGCPLKDLNTFNLSGTVKTRDYILSETCPEIVFTMGSSHINTIISSKNNDYSLKSCYCASNELMQLYEQEGVEDLRPACYYEGHSTARGKYGQRKIGSKDAGTVRVFEAFVIRTIEAYLNKAEAQAMSGDISGAIVTLQPVLDTRYVHGKQPQIGLLGEEELVNFIRDERRRELCFEGHRWADLRRYAVAPKHPLKKEIRHTIYTAKNNTGGDYAGYFVLKPYGEDGGWVLPYPESEIIYNNGALVNTERPERNNEDSHFNQE